MTGKPSRREVRMSSTLCSQSLLGPVCLTTRAAMASASR
ncbi:hypothetical protein J2Z49_001942 [Desulfofundulus luciae]|uniref:Uncharacterized protein n=1 Tax=Desulfofundulus luciae TaxID=74702 RepID=A0ABU0B3I7_9FIRM|nr:hypothetical protein [Desulfofundulus luciae]